MKRNPVETILGFFVLIFTGVFLFFAASRVDTKKIEGYTVTADFMKIGGLEVGSDVRISGIKVGSVLATTLNQETYTANVTLGIDNRIQLPVDTVAAIADVGVMGGKYVRLEPGKSQKMLENNGKITRTNNYKSLEESISEFIFLSTK